MNSNYGINFNKIDDNHLSQILSDIKNSQKIALRENATQFLKVHVSSEEIRYLRKILKLIPINLEEVKEEDKDKKQDQIAKACFYCTYKIIAA